MKIYLYSLIVMLFAPVISLSQASVCLGTDITVCQGQTLTINNCNTSSSGGIFMNAPTTVTGMFDDNWSAVIPIGFPFSFYGQTYTSCIIGSNGIVSFNIAQAGGGCAWALGGMGTIPTPVNATARNAAMGSYQDLNPANAGSGPIQYQTIGTAPNRQFIVLYNGVTMFSCTANCAYTSFIFHEGTNIIDYNIGFKGNCPNWNGDLAIQGVQNNAGTVATATPGRNNTTWNALQDSRRYTPTSATNTAAYTVTSIPYQVVSAPSSNLQWRSTLNQTFPYNNGVLNVTAVPPGTTGYFLSGSSCGVAIGSVSDTTFVTRTSVTVSATSTPDACLGGSGTATAVPGVGTAPFTFAWNNSVTQTTATATNLVGGNYSVTMTDVNGCSASANVTIGNVTATTTSSSTLVSCVGGSDGTATASMTPLGTTTTYSWNDANAQTTQTAVGLPIGTYICTITSNNGCTEQVTVVVSQVTPLTASIVNQQDVTCYTGNDGIITVSASNGTAPYSFSWSGSTSTTSTANDLFVGQQQVDVTDANGCLVTLNTTLSEPLPLVIDSMSLDTMICSESSITIGAVGIGGSSNYLYTWFENGVQISTSQYVLVDPTNSGTQYKVVLSEVCGSPTTADSLIITFPTPIVPSTFSVPAVACAPDTFSFVNTSSNSMEIASTLFLFGNGSAQNRSELDSTKQFFSEPGSYDVDLVVTSIFGCVYTANIPNVNSALERPNAWFTISRNPTSVFETRVEMSDKSIDAVTWSWTADQAIPSATNNQNPQFQFPQVEGEYPIRLTVTSAAGCWDTITQVLRINSDFIMYAPNTFTPDGDEHNPTWKVITEGLDISAYELTVFNRWGQIVWQTFDPNGEWDGTFNGRTVPSGIYSWKARLKEIGKEDSKLSTGNVNILR